VQKFPPGGLPSSHANTAANKKEVPISPLKPWALKCTDCIASITAPAPHSGTFWRNPSVCPTAKSTTRRFDKAASITLGQLETILDCATRGLPADFLEPPGAQLNDLYLIAHSVQGLKPGAYFFQRERNTMELLKEGEFRAEAHHLGLKQDLPAEACVDIFFLADLKPILERYGNRGYRAVQLEAGAIGGRMYLAAYARRWGATGLTFFDDDVVSFFSPHAKDKSAIFLLAIGKPLQRKRQ
jgi:SagB-type dehydrogenase family enzyme